MILGMQLLMLIGPGVPIPAPLALTDALSSIQVNHSDSGHSGFELTFQVGRSSAFDLLEHELVAHPLLMPMSRVILTTILNGVPRVLSDGFITERTLSPSEEPGQSTFSVRGEDVSMMMDLIALKFPHPAQDETIRVQAILARYQAFLLFPPITFPPNSVYFPPPTEEIPSQHGTDRAYIEELAQRFSFRFFVAPGFFPGQNIAYWGPPPILMIPQRGLSVNMGPFSNVKSLSFTQHSLAPTAVVDIVPGPMNIPLPIVALTRLRPPIALLPLPPLRTSLADVKSIGGESWSMVGLNYVRALASAQARVDESYQDAVTATGSLDALQYGDMLMARAIVGVRGAGFTHDGDYYVKSVSHSISKGSYTQNFSLSREGLGAKLPVVIP
jgi:hypothetical protein